MVNISAARKAPSRPSQGRSIHTSPTIRTPNRATWMRALQSFTPKRKYMKALRMNFSGPCIIG